MKKELDDKLCADFPLIFRDRDASVVETPMGFGFDVGDGWCDLIRAACLFIESELKNARSSAIFEHKKNHDPDLPYDRTLSDAVLESIHAREGDMGVVAAQVKEKYGTLRFYWDGENLPERSHDRISGAVEMVEFLSGSTCEECGEKGELRTGGWRKTLCSACHRAPELGGPGE